MGLVVGGVCPKPVPVAWAITSMLNMCKAVLMIPCIFGLMIQGVDYPLKYRPTSRSSRLTVFGSTLFLSDQIAKARASA